METIRRIIFINFLFFFFFVPSVYSEYATSTPSSIESIDFSSILDGFKSIENSNGSPDSSGSSAASSQSQSTTIWTGDGETDLASDPENWSGNLVPQNGDHVLFDGTSIKSAIWNLLVSIYSLIIGSDYPGVVTVSENLAIENFVLWTGAVDNSALNPANWEGNTLPRDGDNILFDGSPSNNCIWDINISPKIFALSSGYTGTVTLDKNLSTTGSLTVSGGTLALSNKALNVDGYLLINPSGTIDAGSSIITVKGNWSNNNGNFIPGTSTVILAGANQTIYGSTIFYNLQKTATITNTLYFEAGSTQKILNSLTLQGVANNLLVLRSTVDGQPWYIDPQGTRNISYADIKDMYNRNFTSIVVLSDSVNSGNNTGVSFGGNECVCFPSKIPIFSLIDKIRSVL